MKTLQITVAFDRAVSHYLNKYIEVPDDLAKELHIKNANVGVLSENARVLKISNRGSTVELPKNLIRIVQLDDVFGCWPSLVPNYLAVLRCASGEKIYMTEIADVLRMSAAGAYDVVSSLEKKGFVNRVFGGNRRYVQLTDEGKRILLMVGG